MALQRGLVRNLVALEKEIVEKATRFSSSSANSISVVDINSDTENRFLRVKFNDGQKASYPFVWLRDNAPEPETMEYTQRCKARMLLMANLDMQISPIKTAITNEGVQVHWSADRPPVTYSSDWLRARNLNSSKLHKWRSDTFHLQQTVSWGGDEMNEISKEKGDWNKMSNDSHSPYLMGQLRKFLKYGFLIVQNVPQETGQLKKFGDILGYMTNNHYGTEFTVKAEHIPSNLAYTSKELGLHTDLPQCQNAPEIQALHCISQAGEGGQNQFCDGFRVAEQLKVEKPEVYRILTEIPVEFVDHGMDKFAFVMAARRPTICTNSDGALDAVYYNNQLRSWYLEVSAEEVPKVYEALKTFNDYCYQARNLFDTKLKPGELVMFSNNRVLHGRSAFSVGEGQAADRHLEGAYYNFDAVRSKIRHIHFEMNTDPTLVTV